MKCDYCKDGVYFGLQFFETCTYCKGSGIKDVPLPPPTSSYITVDEIETAIMDSLKRQVQGQYNPALTPRGRVDIDKTVMLNLTPEQNPTIKEVETNRIFQGMVMDIVNWIDNELLSIHGGQWMIQKAPIGFTLGHIPLAGVRIDWTNPGKNPRRLQVKGKVQVG